MAARLLPKMPRYAPNATTYELSGRKEPQKNDETQITEEGVHY
jgi:hypothetical protein